MADENDISHRILEEIYKIQLRLDSFETKITRMDNVHERLRQESVEMSSFRRQYLSSEESSSSEMQEEYPQRQYYGGYCYRCYRYCFC